MKRTIIICLIAVGLYSCESKPFTGRIVDKEYIAGHRCHTSGYQRMQQASMIPGIVVPHVTVPVHHHKWEKATVTLWVATRNEIRTFSVDSTSYSKWVVGSKVTFK